VNVSGNFNESDEEMRRYSQTVFSNYKEWAGVPRFHGRIAELGPGSVSGVAESVLADGAEHVDQIDNFRYPRRPDPRISMHLAAAEDFFKAPDRYDFILSCAVLEHVKDPLGVVRATAKALKPGGTMVHAVDCRDHGQFSDRFHDLSFLRIPNSLYWPLKLASGLNRVRLSAYLEELRSLDLDLECRALVTALSGIPEDIVPAKEFGALPAPLIEAARQNVARLRPKLARPFREMAEEDLMISGFVLVVRRH
jgi:SAM-dependent methyltransferase